MNRHLVNFTELIVGPWQPHVPIGLARFGLGIVIPAAIFLYGAECVVVQQAPVISREGIRDVIGLPAIAVGIAYAAMGLALYVQICWDSHRYFAGLHDVARNLLLLVIAAALAATVALALL